MSHGRLVLTLNKGIVHDTGLNTVLFPEEGVANGAEVLTFLAFVDAEWYQEARPTPDNK